MQRCVLALALLLAVGPSALARQAQAQPVRHWIFLQDKVTTAGKATTPEPDYLDERARERRLRRGRATSPALDAPLSPDYLDALRRLGVAIRVQSRWLNAVSAPLDAAQVQAVQKLPFVRAVHPVGKALPPPEPGSLPPGEVRPAARKNLQLDYGGSQTQLELINAIDPLERGVNGAGVRLGFLDTEYGGFQHSAFAQMVADGRLLADSNFVGQPQSSTHGLNVASVAIGFQEGELIGPAYGAEVMGATTEFDPTETNQEEDNFVAALEWLEREGVDVVNASIGYNEFDAGQRSYTKDQLDGDTGVTTRAADLAAALGVVVVVSAGNEGNNAWGLVTTPADADSVIAVGAVDSGGQRTSFSSTGPTADGRIKPDVAALGSGVYLARSSGGYGTSGGTSFSSPLVAAVACQMLQVNPDLNPFEVLTILRETASQAQNPDNLLGWGIIDADAAVRRAEALATGTETEGALPGRLALRAPYPNPFADEAVFEVQAPAGAGFARLSVYDLLGRRVDVPFEGTLRPGLNRFVFEAQTLPPGVYLYTLRGDGVSLTGKMVLVR